MTPALAGEQIGRDRATLRFLALPSEAAIDGSTIAAGHVLEWIDRAGFACAAGWSGAYCVTAYVGNVHFRHPIPVGSLVQADARIISTGRSSMQVLVTVSVADPTVGEFTRATHCLLVFVAVDDERRPRPVPNWSPASVAELDLTDRAVRRIAARARIKAAMESHAYTDEGTTPRLLLRFLAAPTDVNWGGSVHGGTVMRWIDEAAHACALSWTRRRTVGVYAGGIHFHKPVHIGHLVEVEARIIRTGGNSVHVATHVRSADPTIGDYSRTTECMNIFVTPDTDGRAAPVPAVPLLTSEDFRLEQHARELISMRAELDTIGDEAP
jgi:4-hydroxybenzoyl-CoA thioesterase